MKKITLLLFLGIASLCFSQQVANPTESWSSKIKPIFQGLNKTRVPNGILLDYAMEFTDVNIYNGNASQLTTNTTVDINVFSNIYKTLFTGRTTTDTLAFPRMKTIANKWALQRINRTQQQQKTIVLGGLYYKYAKIGPNALTQNKITVANNKYYDKYINGVWQDPYLVKETVAFTPTIYSYSKAYFNVVLPQELMLSNQLGHITKIEFNASDGKGYRELTYDQPLSVLYYVNATYTWHYKIQIDNSYYLYASSRIKIEADEFPHVGGDDFETDVVIPGPQGSPLANGAVLRIDYAPNHNGQLQKPFIVAEGFDPGSILEPETEGGDASLDSFKRSFTPEAGINLNQLLDGETQEYDIVYIDWQNGVARLEDNSVVLENVLNWVNTNKVGTEQNVLLGQSMGGLIGRYTLARMEQENKTHDVRLFVSHDAPLQGSNTPLSTQYFTRHLYKEYVSSPELYGVGENLLPLVFGLAELISDAINNINGVNTTVLPYITPGDILTLQDTPAAVQLNKEWVTFSEEPTTALHDLWQQEFDSKGYPQNCRNVAISNGNECAADNGFNPGDSFVEVHDTDDPAFLGDLVHMLTNPIVGSLLLDLELHLLGQLPGSSKYFYDFEIKSTPNSYDPDRNVYFGKVRYEKKLLWLLPISHTVTERAKNARTASLPYGSYSGGLYDITAVTGQLPSQFPPQILINERYGFIPVVSALDVRRSGGVTADDYLRGYAGGIITEPGLSTQFDNFIVDYTNTPTNNLHISFQPRNGDWLARELNETSNNFSDCSILCGNDVITGSDNVCTSGIYSVPVSNDADIVWSISPTNAGTFQGQGTNQIQLSLNSGYSGVFTLSVQIEVDDCDGNVTLSKEIWGGKPNFTFDLEWDEAARRVSVSMIGSNGSDIELQGITSPPTWEVESTFGGGYVPGGSCSGYSCSARGPFNSYNWSVEFKVTATNACGSTIKYITATPPPPPRQTKLKTYDFVSNPNNLYTINSIENGTSMPIENIENSQPDFKIIAFDFTGNPVMETTEARIDISNLKRGIYILKAIIDDTVLTKKVFR